MNKILNNFIKSIYFPLIILALLIVSIPTTINKIPNWLFTQYEQNYKPCENTTSGSTDNNRYSSNALIGNAYGGTLGVTISFIAAYLTFIAFWVQFRSNRQQEDYIKIQRFEDSFFKLLEQHRNNLLAIDTRSTKDLDHKIIAVGSESFRYMYLDLTRRLKGNLSEINVNSEFHKVQNKYKHDLHHYFRFLYHTLKFIKNSDITNEEKFKYSSILRATLSAYELVLLFYNCLHNNGKTHFKPLLEDFSFLKNIDDSLLFNLNQRFEYDQLVFASSEERKKILSERKLRKLYT